MSQNLSSAAVVIGALRVKTMPNKVQNSRFKAVRGAASTSYPRLFNVIILKAEKHVPIQEFLPGEVQARLPENSSDNVFFQTFSRGGLTFSRGQSKCFFV